MSKNAENFFCHQIYSLICDFKLCPNKFIKLIALISITGYMFFSPEIPFITIKWKKTWFFVSLHAEVSLFKISAVQFYKIDPGKCIKFLWTRGVLPSDFFCPVLSFTYLIPIGIICNIKISFWFGCITFITVISPFHCG